MNLMISITNNSKFILLFLLIFILLLLPSCKQSTEPKLEVEMRLELEDVSCTEAWIKLTTNNLQLPATINLIKNNTVAQSFSLNSRDSLLYIDSLLPNQNYKFLVTMQQLNNRSNELSVTTMDTTSHEFSWQSWEFGECSHSTLHDVAIIDENNIWAVGEIYMRDSLGNCDPNAYNAVHWDGTKWELKRIGNIGGWVCHSVFAFSATDIWFEGNIHFDGTRYSAQMNGWPLMPNGDGWQVNKMWGTSSSDLYAVGNNGNIAHWDGVKWRKIESGTDVDLLDVWGSPDGSVWSCGYTNDYGLSVLLKIKGNNIIKYYEGFSNNIINGHYAGPISGIWTDNNYRVFVMNWMGVFVQKDNYPYSPDKKLMNFGEPSYGIDGISCNNIVVCGQRFVGHWNGKSYKEYPELITHPFLYLKNVSVKRNYCCIVGKDYSSPIYSKAIVLIGKQ